MRQAKACLMETFNHLFFSFKGRIGRKAFWLSSIGILVLETALAMVLVNVFDPSIYDLSKPDLTDQQMIGLMNKLDTLALLSALIFLWPTLAVYVKRWHDRNKSGWWTILAFVPIIGQLWTFIELGFLRGTRGINRFGADPVIHP